MQRHRRREYLEIVDRIRAIRREMFGRDVEKLASALDIPVGTWLNYEAGVAMPAEIFARFLSVCQADPIWVLNGWQCPSTGIKDLA